jgi:uncharacterized protein
LRALDPPPVELRWKSKRVPFLSSFCCPPNLARTIAESSGYAWSKSSDGLWLNLYASNKLKTRLSDGSSLQLTEETDYPWNGRVQIRIDECSEMPFALHMRIPSWARGASLRLNGNLTDLHPTPGSYCELRRSWHGGDTIALDLPMSPRLIEANPFVEETLNQVVIQRGPLIYCLESLDLPSKPQGSIRDVFIPSNIDLVARFDRSLLNGIVLLEGKAQFRRTADWNSQLYRELQITNLQPINLRFIPYFAWANRGPSEMTVWLPLSQ